MAKYRQSVAENEQFTVGKGEYSIARSLGYSCSEFKPRYLTFSFLRKSLACELSLEKSKVIIAGSLWQNIVGKSHRKWVLSRGTESRGYRVKYAHSTFRELQLWRHRTAVTGRITARKFKFEKKNSSEKLTESESRALLPTNVPKLSLAVIAKCHWVVVEIDYLEYIVVRSLKNSASKFKSAFDSLKKMLEIS